MKMSIETAESIIIPFGKHKGVELGEIADTDILYLDWLWGQDWLHGDILEAVGIICEARSDEINRAAEESTP